MNIADNRSTYVTFGFWVLLILGSLFFLYYTRQNMRWGIDLVGGTYITLAVQAEKAVDEELAEKMQFITKNLKNKGKQLPKVRTVKDGKMVLTFENLDARQSAAEQIRSDAPSLTLKTVDDTILELTFGDKEVQKIKDEAVKNNMKVIDARLNKLNVEETPIRQQGTRNIIVELPGVDDPQKAMEMMGKMAKLEFKLVERTGSSREDILYTLEGEELPPDKQILRDKSGMYYLVQRFADVTGKHLKNAEATIGGKTGIEPVVAFKFNDVGGDKFFELTSKNKGRQVAIILDDVVQLAPSIDSEIREGGVITGMGDAERAKDLALLLRSGAFSAPVSFEETRQVGPSLGSELIHQSLFSCLIGLILLFLFAVLYYKLSGFFAFTALLVNLLLTLVGMRLMGATLTLPGIAGLVLTVGMAIDCSILIYERIREELANGIGVKAAISNGFSDAMVVILDSNITHLLTGIVLYIFGTGPIQGFAITFILGIAATLITGLFFLRTLFNFMTDTFDVKKLSI